MILFYFNIAPIVNELDLPLLYDPVLFGFSLLYTDRVPFELLDSAALL
jgi:hypothetical protein